ncbi:hypothetical protein BofuT4_P028450.1 [Botrytis cinerea T4]|uniref:Uncharacterized protein n=1 Tax=Botryotinia fuckeliana (strain T4) TaxID=999810 RepID=G2Y8P3_BOTF4|nr:hypothetical protein BofuT4_P028450.1 [Botrytis cinerea T4]
MGSEVDYGNGRNKLPSSFVSVDCISEIDRRNQERFFKRTLNTISALHSKNERDETRREEVNKPRQRHHTGALESTEIQHNPFYDNWMTIGEQNLNSSINQATFLPSRLQDCGTFNYENGFILQPIQQFQ